MKTIQFDHDISIMCLTAKSFPDGVLAAHNQLHSLCEGNKERRFYGISRPEGGKEIIYKAGAEELSAGESEKSGLERITLKAGTYISVVIKNFMEKIPSIGTTFQQMLDRPDLDPNGYCVECYLAPGMPNEMYENEGITDKDVRCMVRLNNENS